MDAEKAIDYLARILDDRHYCADYAEERKDIINATAFLEVRRAQAKRWKRDKVARTARKAN